MPGLPGYGARSRELSSPHSPAGVPRQQPRAEGDGGGSRRPRGRGATPLLCRAGPGLRGVARAPSQAPGEAPPAPSAPGAAESWACGRAQLPPVLTRPCALLTRTPALGEALMHRARPPEPLPTASSPVPTTLASVASGTFCAHCVWQSTGGGSSPAVGRSLEALGACQAGLASGLHECPWSPRVPWSCGLDKDAGAGCDGDSTSGLHSGLPSPSTEKTAFGSPGSGGRSPPRWPGWPVVSRGSGCSTTLVQTATPEQEPGRSAAHRGRGGPAGVRAGSGTAGSRSRSPVSPSSFCAGPKLPGVLGLGREADQEVAPPALELRLTAGGAGQGSADPGGGGDMSSTVGQ